MLKSIMRHARNWGALALVTAVVGAQANLLSNPGFENVSGLGWGNNIGISISPWILSGTDRPNVVQVDGVHAYANNPTLDADPTTGVGVVQHYLDIVGANDFYQTFTVPQCGILPTGQTRTVNFSGWFSARDNLTGAGTISIRSGAGIAGALLSSQSVTIDRATSLARTWVQASGSVAVPTGSQISYVVTMGQNVNFDQASMTFSDVSGACPTATLTLVTQWENALVGDSVTFSATGTSGTTGLLGSLSSTAVTASTSDTSATPIYVASGDVIDLSSIQAAVNQSGYTAALSCTGAATLAGSTLTVNSSGTTATCTLTLTRNIAASGLATIPTMSEWALLCLSIVLGGFAWIRLRQIRVA